MSKEQLKAQASRLANHLATTYGWKLSHQKSLNALSVTLGARNWHTMQVNARPTANEHIDWGHQALARWTAEGSTRPLLSQLVKSRNTKYSQTPGFSKRIERVSCGRIPGGLLALDRADRIALTEIHRDEGSSFAVVSSAGAGKSFVVQELMADTLRRGGTVHAIDPDNTHRKFCRQLRGLNLELKLENPLGLSPFSQYRGEDFEEDLCPLLTDLLLELLAAASDELASSCRDTISAALSTVWRENLQASTFTAVLEVLRNTGSAELRQSVESAQADWHLLGPWLDAPADVATSLFDGSLVVVDADALTKTPRLLNTVLMLLALHSRKALLGMPRSRPRLLVIEDADWHLRHLRRSEFLLRIQKDLDNAGAGLGVSSARLVGRDAAELVPSLIGQALTVFVGQLTPSERHIAAARAPWSQLLYFAESMAHIRIDNRDFAVIQHHLPPRLIRVALDAYSTLLYSMNPFDCLRTKGLSNLPEHEHAQQLQRLADENLLKLNC